MKKLWLLFSLSLFVCFANEDLDNYLSEIRNRYFDYEDRLNALESDMLTKSWINPISINYQYTKSNYPTLKDSINRTFSIGINQPIFKSGGIFYAVKYAKTSEIAKSLGIYKKKRALIVQLLNLLYDIKKIKLQKKQLKLSIKNDNIDIKRKSEQYRAGVVDSSLLDQAILKRNQDKTKFLALELEEHRLKSLFSTMSNKNPDKLKLPRLKLIKKSRYQKSHLDIASDMVDVEMREYNSKITRAKYLPTISVSANYKNSHSNIPTPGFRDSYHTLGLGVSMPININSKTDIEKSKVAYLKSMIKLQDDKKRISSEYDLIVKSIEIINQKIALAKSDERLYRNLLKSTKEQFRAGNRTKLDVETMRNSLKLSKLERQIYKIEREKQILKLYEKIKLRGRRKR